MKTWMIWKWGHLDPCFTFTTEHRHISWTLGLQVVYLQNRQLFLVWKTRWSGCDRALWFWMGFTVEKTELMVMYPSTTWHHFHPTSSELHPPPSKETTRLWWCALGLFQPFPQGHNVGVGFFKLQTKRLSSYGPGLQKLGLCSIYFYFLLKWKHSSGQDITPEEGDRGIWWIFARDRHARWCLGTVHGSLAPSPSRKASKADLK